MQNYNSNGVVNSSSDINIPYGWCLLPSNSHNRQGAPGPDIFGNGKDYTQCIPQIIQPASVIGPQNTSSVNNLDQFFLQQKFIPGLNEKMYSNTDLQPIRPDEPSTDYYISLASETLHVKPDLTFSIFFSDANINHLRETVVKKVKEIKLFINMTNSFNMANWRHKYITMSEIANEAVEDTMLFPMVKVMCC